MNSTVILRKRLKSWLLKKLYKKVDKVIAQSKGMALDLIENYLFQPNKVIVINNPVSFDIEHNNILDANCRRNKNEVLFVGRLVPQKGLFQLIKIVSICVKVLPDLKLKIVGEGPLKELLQKKIIELGLEKNITIYGFSDNIIKFYSNASLTVLASLYEGFPNVLVESISLGTPVVSFDCPSGPSEIIIEGVNGFLVKQGDINEMSKKILTALKTNWDRKRIIATAYRYSSNYIIAKYIKLIEELNHIS